ncbi:Wadjet anti-phage system protein JetD domain-containing protein [Thiolapillus sp.]
MPFCLPISKAYCSSKTRTATCRPCPAHCPAVKTWYWYMWRAFAAARRIREPQGVSLHYHAGSNLPCQGEMEAWWFQQATANWPLWFWGDLDYAGMGILKALKQRFAKLAAWQPGYIPMLTMLQEGKGHSAEAASKQAQSDPGSTGCDYADNVLLPAMRRHKAFIDQESISQASTIEA